MYTTILTVLEYIQGLNINFHGTASYSSDSEFLNSRANKLHKRRKEKKQALGTTYILRNII